MNNDLKVKSSGSDTQTSVGKAILLGHLVVNALVLLIIFGSLGLGSFIGLVLRAVFPSFSDNAFLVLVLICFGAGLVSLGWLWWSFSVPRWRQCALSHGAPAEQLHRWAVLTGLEWPKGHFFEKTEFKLKK